MALDPTEAFLRNEFAVSVGRSVHPEASGVLQVHRSIELFGNSTGSVGFRAPATAHGPIYVLPASDSTTAGAVLTTDASGNLSWSAAPVLGTVHAIFDGGTSALTTTANPVYAWLPFAFQITEAVLVATPLGSISVAIDATGYDAAPPNYENVITGSAPLVISGGQKTKDATLSSWTTIFASDTVLRFRLNSVSTVKLVTVALKIVKGDYASPIGAMTPTELVIGQPGGDGGVGAIATEVGGRPAGGDYGGPYVCTP